MRQMLCRSLYELISVVLQELYHKLRNLAVMGGLFQFIAPACRLQTAVKCCRYDEFLPQRRFLGKYAVVGKDLQIFYVDFIVCSHFPSPMIARVI